MCFINLKEIILIIIVAHCIETYDCLQHASCEIGARKHSSRCCISGSFGTQCTAIALIALIFASFKVEINTWAPQHLDTIIFEGDTLYGRIINERFNGDTSRYLSHNELPAQFTAFGEVYHQRLVETLFGAVNDQAAVSAAGAVSLQNALSIALNISPQLIGTFGESSVAIFSHRTFFYLFDSHSRNSMGYVDPSGSSALLTFDSVNSLTSKEDHRRRM